MGRRSGSERSASCTVSYRVGREVQIGEQRLPRAQQAVFALQRFLHLDDDVRPVEYLPRGGQHFRARVRVFLVRDAAALSRAAADEHGMPRAHKRVRTLGREGNAVFVVFDLFGNANNHITPLFCNISVAWILWSSGDTAALPSC